MTTITILPEKADTYRAIAGDKESTGRTAGEALDALTSQFSDDEGGTLVILQNYKADEFFNAAQRERLTELMQLRQTRRLSPEEEQQLESLIEAEIEGARLRTERNVRQRLRADVEVRQKLRADVEIGRHRRRELSLIISSLSDLEKRLLHMYVIEDLSPQEIAAVLNEDASKILHILNKMLAKIRYRVRKSLSGVEKKEG